MTFLLWQPDWRAAVSLLLALGVPPHVVREIAGHSDIKVTMTVHAHGNLTEKAAALAQLGGTLLSPTDVKPVIEQGGDQ